MRTLWLSSAPQITKEAICRIGNFRFITALHLKQHPTVDNETLNAFSGLPLEKLHLESLDRVVGHECVDTAILTHTRLCSLSLVSIPEFHDAALAKLTRLTNLTSLGCDCRDVVDVGFSDVARMTKLVSLEVLTQESLTDDLVEPLRNHPSMQRLVLSHSLLLSSISAPASIRTLRVLDLTRCSSIRDDEFEPLRDHPTLVTIRASNCHEVTRHACEVFATIAGLKELYINGCSKLEDSDLEWFGANNSLRVLDLSKTRIDGSGLQWLARIRTLEELVLNSVRLLQPGVINVFSGHESLAVVSLTGTRLLSGREVKSLLRCPKIKKVLTNAEHAQLLADRYPRRLVLL